MASRASYAASLKPPAPVPGIKPLAATEPISPTMFPKPLPLPDDLNPTTHATPSAAGTPTPPAPTPTPPPTPPVAPAAEAAAAKGGRKWFQMLTHSAEGKFSGTRAGVTAAAVAAVAAGGIYLATRNPKKDPDATWVDQIHSEKTVTAAAHR